MLLLYFTLFLVVKTILHCSLLLKNYFALFLVLQPILSCSSFRILCCTVSRSAKFVFNVPRSAFYFALFLTLQNFCSMFLVQQFVCMHCSSFNKLFACCEHICCKDERAERVSRFPHVSGYNQEKAQKCVHFVYSIWYWGGGILVNHPLLPFQLLQNDADGKQRQFLQLLKEQCHVIIELQFFQLAIPSGFLIHRCLEHR